MTSAANIRVIISPSKRPARKHKNQGVNCVLVLPYENERQHNHKAIANLITSMNFLMWNRFHGISIYNNMIKEAPKTSTLKYFKTFGLPVQWRKFYNSSVLYVFLLTCKINYTSPKLLNDKFLVSINFWKKKQSLTINKVWLALQRNS